MAQERSLPPLVKQSDSFKLFIPRDVEAKIRYLQNKFPHTEWSGVLFTTHTGSFENKDLRITCVDIYPMDLGSHTYTEFKMSPDVAAYIAENMEKLWDCDTNLIHSHSDFQTFFSGTDTATLRSEGNDTNNFVSLIVNNEGTYSAAVTRKLSVSSIVTEEGFYSFFGDDAPIPFTNSYNTGKEERIEYFMLDIEKEEYDNPFSYIDTRFKEIEESKKAVPQVEATPLLDFPKPLKVDKEPSLFTKEEMGETELPDIPLDWTSIHAIASKLLLCSLIINPDKLDMEKWVNNSMVNLYNKTFHSSDSRLFIEYCDWAVEFILDHYKDDALTNIEDDVTYLSVVSQAFAEELMAYDAKDNPYMDAYIDTFNAYVS